jgi:hypothetical protein
MAFPPHRAVTRPCGAPSAAQSTVWWSYPQIGARDACPRAGVMRAVRRVVSAGTRRRAPPGEPQRSASTGLPGGLPRGAVDRRRDGAPAPGRVRHRAGSGLAGDEAEGRPEDDQARPGEEPPSSASARDAPGRVPPRVAVIAERAEGRSHGPRLSDEAVLPSREKTGPCSTRNRPQLPGRCAAAPDAGPPGAILGAVVGWPMGVEPITFGTTIRCSAG